ncbi:uncharacterized protein LOC123532990 [Mercenaria mercenaria]|uniref:uncharacterized protein LOC123532990 n=1 Tax=Mercenaria mercenaria TaxID=6596 RepID=UPI00234F8D63|nr:uncharacterized protein LOC123532990 [Mercenaria mercenaria]
MSCEFFTSGTPHSPDSRVKRLMYKKYLQAFIPITQQAKDEYGQQCTTAIIDGFAGAGRYGDEWPAEIEAYGSPLIALMVSLNHFYRKEHGNDKLWRIQSSERDIDAEIVDMVATMSLSENASNVEPKIELCFMENDDACFKSLKDNIAEVLEYFFPNPDVSYTESETEDGHYQFKITHPNYPISCKLINEEFTNCIPDNLLINNDSINNDSIKCLIFLDPFFFSQTPMTHVEKYVGPGNFLLINFMSSFVNRMNETLSERIEALYGIPYLRMKALEKGIPTGSLDEYVTYLVRQFDGKGNGGRRNNIQSRAATYERMLKNVFGTATMPLTFEMRGRKNNIIYHLIFITDDIKGVEIMKEAMHCCSQVESELRMSNYQLCRNDCIMNLGNTKDVTVVADTLYEKFEGCSKVKISQVKDYVLLETPYVFRKQCLAGMEKDGKLVHVVDIGLPPMRREVHPSVHWTTVTTWYLTFPPTEETVNLAKSIYENFARGDQPVPLSYIKKMLRDQDFKENALLMMASERDPRCYICYKCDMFMFDQPEWTCVLSSDREWYIVFRPPANQQINGQIVPGTCPIESYFPYQPISF